MDNERLRLALSDAGFDEDQLAELVGVQPETVVRWVRGRVPYPRNRAAVARALSRPEHELWPDHSPEQPGDDLSEDVLVTSAQVGDAHRPDWAVLIEGASAQIDLAGQRLGRILSTPGVVELLSEKAAASCRVRVLLPDAHSLWLGEAARLSGKGEEDYVGRTEFHRQVELAIGYLQPVLEQPGVDARVCYRDLSLGILRFDHMMLVRLPLAGGEDDDRPVLHVEQQSQSALFDRLGGHLETLHRGAFPLEPDPVLFPDPVKTPARYQPVTERIYRGRVTWLEQQLPSSPQIGPPPGRSGRLTRPNGRK